MRKRKLPPRVRKGNHPSNPYAEGQKDREGLSLLSDEIQLGMPPPLPPVSTTLGGEPTYILRASNPFSGMVLRFMANAAIALSIPLDEARKIRETALAMDLWRARDSGGG